MSKKKDKKAKKAQKNQQQNGLGGSGATNAQAGMFAQVSQWLAEHPTEQFLLGAAVGAAAVYVLSNEEVRGKIMKGGLDLYASLAGGFAELREQMADIKAEMDLGAAA